MTDTRLTVAERKDLEELRAYRKKAVQALLEEDPRGFTRYESANTVAKFAAVLVELDAAKKKEKQFMAIAELLAHDVAMARNTETGLGFDLLCSDTFQYACADSEAISMEAAPEVLEIYRDYGWKGVDEWVQAQRGGPEKSPFIKPVVEFHRSEEMLREEIKKLTKQVEGLTCQLEIAQSWEM